MSTPRRRLAAAALVLLLAGCAATPPAPGPASPAATPPAPPLAARVERVGDAIVFDGRIEAATAAAFLRLLQAPGVRRLVVTSRGGLVAPALDMAFAIHARGLDVEVPRSCLSSCANYLFPAGRRKRLGTPTAVGWHGNMHHVLWLQQTGQASWPAADLAQARELARREAQLYAQLGVDGFVAWFGKLPPFSVADFHALAPADLARFGLHGVTLDDPQAPPQPQVELLRPGRELPAPPHVSLE